MADAKAKIAVVLSGCGVFDGSEIHEATLTLLALDRQGAEYQCYAPDVDQAHVINHVTGEEMAEKRNVLIEAARIARGEIKALGDFNASEVDAVIFPGGFGAAKNLSSFAFDGAQCTVQPDVARVVGDMVEAKKPIGAMCIAPAALAKILDGAEMTIGQDAGVAKAIEAMGCRHTPAMHGEIVVDENLKLVTTPCYMLESTIGQIADGAENTVKAILEML